MNFLINLKLSISRKISFISKEVFYLIDRMFFKRNKLIMFYFIIQNQKYLPFLFVFILVSSAYKNSS
jgi:hypothetical protein